MANSNKCGMTPKQWARLRASRGMSVSFPSNSDFQGILADWQAGKMSQDEAEKKIKAWQEGRAS